MKAIFIDGPLAGKAQDYLTDPGMIIRTYERKPLSFTLGGSEVAEIRYFRIAKTRDPHAFIYSIEERKEV